jgi:methoxymalonate biosynthesis protein
VKTVKCLVWDLDNTLWQGTFAEDETLELTDEIRAVIVELDRRGILQSIASKNDHGPVWAHLEKLEIAEYFLVPRIGWGIKSQSVREIAEELNFALDTIAFIDDQPAERSEVEFHLPQVRCYPADEVLSLVSRPDFTQNSSTVDSRRRRQMYRAGFERTAARSSFTGADSDFLRTLQLRMTIKRAWADDLSRLEELTLRTSQMNATGVPYPDAVLRGLLSDPRHEVLGVTMSDRFGDHGAVGIVLLERYSSVWHLKLLATSCRVVTWGAGSTILNWLSDQAFRAGAHLVADLRRTDRNRMMEVAYRFAGFTDENCSCRGDLDPPRLPLERLHLRPTAQPASPTITVTATDIVKPSSVRG